jgi:predicted PurR-regulated permease PerM
MSSGPSRPLVPPLPTPTLAEKVVRAVVWALVGTALVLVVRALSFLLAPFALSLVAFYMLSPVVNLLENRHLERRNAVALCFGGLLVLMLLAFSFIWPTLDGWLQEVPQPGERSVFELQLEARLQDWATVGQRRFPGLDWSALFEHVRQGLEGYRRRWMEALPARATEALSSTGVYLLAPVVALFLLLEGTALHRRLVSYVPNPYFELVVVLLHRVDRQIAAYLRGAATQALIISALTALVLFGVGMPSAMLMGCIFGILNVIPLVGPVLGASVGLLYSLLDPTAPSMPVLIACYFGVHVVDLALVTPWVVGKSLDLHPVTIIVGLTVGGTVGGILGMLVSIPLIAVAKAMVGTVLEAYRRHELS